MTVMCRGTSHALPTVLAHTTSDQNRCILAEVAIAMRRIGAIGHGLIRWKVGGNEQIMFVRRNHSTVESPYCGAPWVENEMRPKQ